MLCKFTGGGPENGTRQEIADDVMEVRCTGLTPGFAEVYKRDPKRPKRFIYKGQVANDYHPAFHDKKAIPDWLTNPDTPAYDLATGELIKPKK